MKPAANQLPHGSSQVTLRAHARADGTNLLKNDVKLCSGQVFAHEAAVLEYLHEFCTVQLGAGLPACPEACIGLEDIGNRLRCHLGLILNLYRFEL